MSFKMGNASCLPLGYSYGHHEALFLGLYPSAWGTRIVHSSFLVVLGLVCDGTSFCQRSIGPMGYTVDTFWNENVRLVAHEFEHGWIHHLTLPYSVRILRGLVFEKDALLDVSPVQCLCV